MHHVYDKEQEDRDVRETEKRAFIQREREDQPRNSVARTSIACPMDIFLSHSLSGCLFLSLTPYVSSNSLLSCMRQEHSINSRNPTSFP